MEGWVAEELGTVQLGDPRRAKRLMAVVEALAAHPGASVPEAWGSWAATKGTYRLWDSTAVTPTAIRSAHRDATLERIRADALILAIQDTTELSFSAQAAMQGLGPLAGRGRQGILVHSVLAVSPTGVPLGVLEQETWTRGPEQAGSRHTRRKRITEEKESGRWLRAQAATLAALSPQTDVLTIADREADIYDFFAAPRRAGAELLVRAAHPRRIADTEAGEAAYVWTTLQASAPAGAVTVQLGRTPTRPERAASLTIRFQSVELQPPRHHKGRTQCRPISLTAILATEEHPPNGQTAVSWRLLTSWPVDTLADALGLVEAYTFRWLVERYHYVLKSGCGIEELHLARAERLERAFATVCIVAWRLLWLTYRARHEPDTPGAEELRPDEAAVLCATMGWERLPDLHQTVRAIAQLGGFLGRAGDGEPGVEVLWRGLRQLHLLARGWELHHMSSTGQLVGNG